jgi:very-short-patch-repair endonuclease
VGDRSAARQCGVGYLAAFANYVDTLKDGATEPPKTPVDFGPAYPPVTRPEQVSDWERIFYDAMYRAGIRAIPQYNVEQYALDFAVFSGDCRLDVEVDGERYHRNWDGDLIRRDQIRNQRLIELGWDIMRFWVYQVRDDPEGCTKRVREWVAAHRAQSAQERAADAG